MLNFKKFLKYTIDNTQENMNCHWWKLRSEIQGIAPPSQRNNQQFDPGAKRHVADDMNYVRYTGYSLSYK